MVPCEICSIPTTPTPNTDAENIPDLTAPVTLSVGVLHDMEHQLMILAAQLGLYA